MGQWHSRDYELGFPSGNKPRAALDLGNDPFVPGKVTPENAPGC